MLKRIKTALVFTFIFICVFVFYLKQFGGLKLHSDEHQQDMLNWVCTSQGCIHVKTFTSDSMTGNPELVLIIHGDAPFNKPGYHYRMAEKIARQNKNTIALGILRPGYTDPENNTSNGIQRLTTGDNYTPEVILAIAETVQKIKKYYHPSKTILVGHSGGSNIAADVASLYPNLVNDAVLVSCPCDLEKWRNHMAKKQIWNPNWLFAVRSISPLLISEDINDSTHVILITGTKDDITPPFISIGYYEKLKVLHKNATYILIPDEGHEVLLNDTVARVISGLIN